MLPESSESGSRKGWSLLSWLCAWLLPWRWGNRPRASHDHAAEERYCARLRTGGPEDILALIKILGDEDQHVAAQARENLALLDNAKSIDVLCGHWVGGRNPNLGAIIAECNYVASGPLRVRVLSALQAGRPELLFNSGPVDVVELLMAAKDADQHLSSGALQALAGLHNPAGIDELCETVWKEPDGTMATLCTRSGHRPSKPGAAALFLVATRQVEAYFALNQDIQLLRQAYQRAAPSRQVRVLDIIFSSDLRFADFFEEPKLLAECNFAERALAKRILLWKKDWAKVWVACLELPLGESLDLWPRLAESHWQPAEAYDQKCLAQTLGFAQALQGDSLALAGLRLPSPAGSAQLIEFGKLRPKTAQLTDLNQLLLFLSQNPPPRAAAAGRLLEEIIKFHLSKFTTIVAHKIPGREDAAQIVRLDGTAN